MKSEKNQIRNGNYLIPGFSTVRCGERLRQARERSGISQEDLAEVLQVKGDIIKQLEEDNVDKLSLLEWRLAANILNVPVCYFVVEMRKQGKFFLK